MLYFYEGLKYSNSFLTVPPLKTFKFARIRDFS